MDDDDGPGFTLSDAEPSSVPNGAAINGKRRDGRGGSPRPRRRDERVLLLSDVDLWRGATDGAAYASVPLPSGRLEHVAVRSAGYRDWLMMAYLERHGGGLSGQAFKELEALSEARAKRDGSTRTAWRRVAFEGDRIWLDLGGGDWNGERRAVEIGPDGSRVVDEAPVAFLRGPDALPLPAPEADAARPEDLLRVANIGANGLELAWAWLCCAARPFRVGVGKYPLLLLHGLEGSGKSDAARRLHDLLDPAKSKGRGLPDDNRELFVSAVARHLLAFDNVSALPDWLSDSLCRILTGGALSTKTLYTDADEFVFAARRPVLLNGIPSTILHRPDLASRALVLECPPLRDAERRTDAEVDAEFDRLRPGLIGLLCDALSAGLRRVDSVRLADPPRMADAATWAEACAAGLGFAEGSVAAAWRANRAAGTREALGSDHLAAAVLALLDTRGGHWSGKPTDGYDLLCGEAGDRVSRGQKWPKSAAAMKGALERIKPGLRDVHGIELELNSSHGKERRWFMRRG